MSFVSAIKAGKAKKADLSTVEGLAEVGRKAGLQKDVSRLLKGGEEPEKIFSGGIITDIFDVLNAVQYGVVGMIKGKGFAEGVKTRQSFTQKDALGDLGLPGMVVGTALDIAVDPFTYIAPWTIFKKIPGATKLIKGAKKASEAFKATRLGTKYADNFMMEFGASKPYVDLIDRWSTKKAVEIRNIVDMAKSITDIPTRRNLLKLGKDGRPIRKSIDELGKILPSDDLAKVQKAWNRIDELGEEAVRLGRLPYKTWKANEGEYIKAIYEKYELGKKTGVFPWAKKGVKKIFKRKELTEEAMRELGRIEDPAVVLLATATDLIEGNETAKMFNAIAKRFGADEALEGFRKLPDNPTRLVGLSGKYVPEPIFKSITEMIRPATELEKTTRKLVGKWKFGKVVLNPATHSRNVMSNFILNGMEGLPPFRLDVYAEGAKELANFRKGKPAKWIDEVLPLGFDINTYAAQELKEMLLSPQSKSAIEGGKNVLTKIQKLLSDLYGDEENWAKISMYIFQRKKGLPVEEAWKIAQRATFNYAQVVPFIRRMRQSIWGYPFITFTAKATPQAIKTIAKHPARISYIGKIKNAIENQADLGELKRERASEPSWIRDGFYIKLPMKDKYGRSAYFDLSYIIPFGDLITWQLFKRPPTAVNLIKELGKNEDFYGNKIWKKSDPIEKQLGDVMRHLLKFAAPAPIAEQIPGGYKYSGERRRGAISRVIAKERGEEDISTQARTPIQEALRNVGLKVTPIDIETQEWWAEHEKEEALKTLLIEAGLIKEFKRAYVPKE